MFPTPTLFTAASRAARASKLDSTSLCWRDQGRADEPENPLRWRAAGQPRRRRRGRDALGRRRGRADGGGGGICAAPARGRRCGAQKRPHRLLGRCAHHADIVRQREIASMRPAMHTGGRCTRARRLRCAALARPAWLPPVWWLQPSMAAAACVAPASCLPVAPLRPGVQARGQQPPSAERPAPACAPSGARTRREGDAWSRARRRRARGGRALHDGHPRVPQRAERARPRL